VDLAGLGDDEAADRIRETGIDILVDLSGHTEDHRLLVFARKPAPVQATWLGYFNTTGLDAMDYFIGDPYSTPAEHSGHFVEKLWNLPETRFCFTPPSDDAPVAPLPCASGAPFTFGCFNHPAKVNERVVALWARVIKAVPGSRLLLKSRSFNEEAVCAAMLARFLDHGVGHDAILFEGSSPRNEYLRAFQRVDIVLDPFPYTGGATSMDGLWMGVPLLTLTGDRLVARQGESILRNLSMPDWIARDEDDFVERAVKLAADRELLGSLRTDLRTVLLESPMCDAPRFARHLEAALRGMWEGYCVES
jgi:predicted O-linked N-acetylglucosamine transferase (SPINDLY family)